MAQESIEYGTQGRRLSDGNRYRVEDQSGGYYNVYKDIGDAWKFVGRIGTEDETEEGLVEAVENMQEEPEYETD